MTPRTSISNWLLEKRRPLIFAGVVLFTLGIGEAIEHLEFLRSPTTNFVNRGLELDWNRHTVILRDWFLLVLFFFSVGLVTLLLFWLRAEILLRRCEREFRRKSETAMKTLRGMSDAALRVKEQLFPIAKRPAAWQVSVHNTYLIHKNFDADVKRIYEYKAVDEPIHFWEIELWVESVAASVDFLDDINFKIRDGLGRVLTYLPIENAQRNKRVIVYFLPQIEPGESDARKIVVTYKWPRMFAKLDCEGSEIFRWKLNSKKNVKNARFEFFLQPGTGGNLECEFWGGRVLGDSLSRVSRTNDNEPWQGWAYQLVDAPQGEYCLKLTLKAP